LTSFGSEFFLYISDVGLDERISKLLDGYDTYLTRNFNRDGTELSGGQAQKLAIIKIPPMCLL